jgi:anti-anti-sigma factor
MKVVFKIEEGDLTGLRVWDQFSERLTRLVDAGFTEIVVDLGAVRSLSSLALGTIVATNQTMASAGRRLVVTNLSEELKKLAVDTKLLGVISIE